MDKTMELVLVAMVLMVASVIIISMANSQIGGFGESIDEQRNEVEDDLSDELDDVPENSEFEHGEKGFSIPDDSNSDQGKRLVV